jgi:hypothetical protein
MKIGLEEKASMERISEEFVSLSFEAQCVILKAQISVILGEMSAEKRGEFLMGMSYEVLKTVSRVEREGIDVVLCSFDDKETL